MLFVLALALPVLVGAVAFNANGAGDVSERIIAMEKAALERWGNGDPSGYIELYAPEVTYFDPSREERMDGLEALREYYAPIVGKVSVDRFEMLKPKVQIHGDTAVLTFNLVSYVGETREVRWNSTEVYCLIEGEWKIIHSHWSFTKPELKGANPEQADAG